MHNVIILHLFSNFKKLQMAHSGRKVYVLSSECQIIGVWTNLKYLCRDRCEIERFASYSKLSKEIAELRKSDEQSNILTVNTKDGKTYQIKIEMLQ